MSVVQLRSAISRIESRGMTLVFPIANAKEPPSLWYEFYPRTEMRWEWDSDGDRRVADLWHLRERLSCSGKVVYTKWYRGRATFFSKKLFTAFLRSLSGENPYQGLSPEALEILRLLEESSPLSTKALKKQAHLEGRFLESTYTRALKELWNRLLIVGYGEVDDGAFPSLAMGATELMFEELWKLARSIPLEKAQADIKATLGEGSPFYKDYVKRLALLSAPPKKATYHFGR